MDSRLPKLIFVLLVLYAAVHFSITYRQLPPVVASHFGAHGETNGWQPKAGFFLVFVIVGVLAAVVGFGIPRIITAIPTQLINLPNKNYWLAPERLVETMEFMVTCFAWFGCTLFLFLILVFDFAVQINLHPEHPPSSARLWYMLAGFLVFTMAWTVGLLAKFFRPSQTLPGAK